MILVTVQKFLFFMLTVKLVQLFQNDYALKHEKIEIVDYNKNFLENPRLVLFWYNRTTKAFNGSTHLKQDSGTDVKVNVTVHKFSNNQFRLYPAEIHNNPCSFIKNNLFGVRDIALRMNVTGCPVQKGYYGLDNVTPDVTKFPPYLIPYGRYRICGSMYIKAVFLGSACWQGEVLAVNPY